MAMKWTLFLLSAVVAVIVGLGVVGGWLMPQLGIEGPLARGIGAGLAGAVIAVLYFRMIKGAGGA